MPKDWGCLIALICAFLATGVPEQADGQVCGTTELDLLQDAALAALTAADDFVEARVVFVSFPDYVNQTLPSWRDEFRTEFEDFIQTMSGGQQQMHITVVTRPDQSDLAWIAQNPASHYYNQGSGGYGNLNQEVMTQINMVIPNVWIGVDQVFMIHYRATINLTCCPGAVGVGSLGCAGCAPGSIGRGTTQFFSNDAVEQAANREGAKWVAAHEYGHTLGFNHTPLSEGAGPGRYDVMRASASYVQEDGLVPYHALHLSNPADVAWLPVRQVITSDVEGLRVPDIRGPSPATFEVRSPAAPTQSYLLVNHRTTSSPYDAKYQSSGLYVWHMLNENPGNPMPDALDLESAEGKYVPIGTGSCLALDFTQPAPVSGKDRLEACTSQLGTYLDVFDGVQKTFFTCATNPNANRYAGSHLTPQSVSTSIALENIHPDPITGDMLVDVFVTPKQNVLAPNGGEVLHEGQPYPIQWTVRPNACITSLDLNLSSNGGGSFTPIAQFLSNSGQYMWTPTVSGTQFRVQTLSRDQAAGTGVDDSNANFSVIDVTAPAMVEDLTIDVVSDTEVYLYWYAPGDNGNVGTALSYELRYSTQPLDEATFGSGMLAATAAPQAANSAEQAVVRSLNPCTGYYFALKTRDEANNWATISNVTYTQTVCMGGGGGGGFSAQRPRDGEKERASAASGVAPNTLVGRASDEAGARLPGLNTVLASADGFQPSPGILVVETKPNEGGAWRVSLRLATEADGLDASGSQVTVEAQTSSGDRDTLGQFTPGASAGILGICALHERGRVVLAGFVGIDQMMARIRRDGHDYALAHVQHSRLGDLGAQGLATGGSTDLQSGDTIDMTYEPAADAHPEAPPWYLLVRREGASTPIPFSKGRDRGVAFPEGFALHRGEPNPAGTTTIIRFDLPVPSPVRLEVFDLLGRRVATVAEAVYSAGEHRAEWDLRDVNGGRVRSGVYMVRMLAGEFRANVGLSVLP